MHQIRKVRLCHILSCINEVFSFLFTSMHLKSLVKLLSGSKESVEDISCHKIMHFSWHQWSWFGSHLWKCWCSLCTSAWLGPRWLSGSILLMPETQKWLRREFTTNRGLGKNCHSFQQWIPVFLFNAILIFFKSESYMKKRQHYNQILHSCYLIMQISTTPQVIVVIN